MYFKWVTKEHKSVVIHGAAATQYGETFWAKGSMAPLGYGPVVFDNEGIARAWGSDMCFTGDDYELWEVEIKSPYQRMKAQLRTYFWSKVEDGVVGLSREQLVSHLKECESLRLATIPDKWPAGTIMVHEVKLKRQIK